MQSIKTEALRMQKFIYFQNKYTNDLKQPNCLPSCLTEVCGGWYQQTYKQVMNKFSKNKTSPFPLFFTSIEPMQLMCQKRPALKEIFNLMDTRNLKRIDATQLYSIMLIMSKADYQSMLKCIVDIFGIQQASSINKGELFFFLDSLFRAFSKFLLTKNQLKPAKPNIRLDYNDINAFVNRILNGQDKILKSEVYEGFERAIALNNLLKHIQMRMAASSQYARQQNLKNLKTELEVKAVVRDMIMEIEKRIKAK